MLKIELKFLICDQKGSPMKPYYLWSLYRTHFGGMFFSIRACLFFTNSVDINYILRLREITGFNNHNQMLATCSMLILQKEWKLQRTNNIFGMSSTEIDDFRSIFQSTKKNSVILIQKCKWFHGKNYRFILQQFFFAYKMNRTSTITSTFETLKEHFKPFLLIIWGFYLIIIRIEINTIDHIGAFFPQS